jgi:plasmid stabilization system protein ParE
VKWRVSNRATADADLHQARVWYDRQRPGLGDEFLLSVADAMTRLEEAPEQFPVYYRGFHRLLTERFPYKIFFRIQGDAVIVFRVLHAARDHSRELK